MHCCFVVCLLSEICFRVILFGALFFLPMVHFVVLIVVLFFPPEIRVVFVFSLSCFDFIVYVCDLGGLFFYWVV